MESERRNPGLVVAWVQAQKVKYRLSRGFDESHAFSRKPFAFRALARTIWAAPEGGRASSIALRAARRAAASPFALREILAAFARTTLGDGSFRLLHSVAPLPVPSPVTGFLLEPVEDGVPRVVAFLDAAELPLPGPGNGSHARLAEWLVHAATAEDGAEEGEVPGPLSGLLARTGQGHLIEALRSALISGIGDGVRPGDGRAPRPYRLWKDAEPTTLTRVLLANPHLLHLPPPPEVEPAQHGRAPLLLLALLKGRADLVDPIMRIEGPHSVVASLRDGLSIAASPEFTRNCRRALRTLDHPAARDDVCRDALCGDQEMLAAAVEAGYRPSGLKKPWVAAFLFGTEQWELYDAADPDGSLLKKFCSRRPSSRPGWGEPLDRGVHTAAHRSGRRAPYPEPSYPRTKPARRGPLGSWPTSPGSVGHDGGGHGGGYDGGGGYSGGGFSF